MDPSKFLRILISNLAIRFPTQNPNLDSSSYFCRFKLTNFPSKSVEISSPDPDSSSCAFTLTRPDIDNVVSDAAARRRHVIKVDVYCRRESAGGCGFGLSERCLGRVVVPVELTREVAEGKASMVLQNGWVDVGGKAEICLTVKVEPDPRFMFKFESDPECSPQVFQIQGGGKVKQPVFSCKFSQRNSSSENDNHNQRKGWSLTIHDLSGSPVAVASMVTPFVPSPGSDKVSRANPGGWLILRPGSGTWKPWGRLEAWQEDKKPNRVGYKFDLSHDIAEGITLAQSSLPSKTAGKFTIDVTDGFPTPTVSPKSSMDFGSGSSSSSTGTDGGWWAGLMMYKGFVMTSTVGGKKSAGVEVVVGAQHVTCAEDAAVYVALAAAMDLSIDACKPFSQKLRKELRQDFVV